MPDKRVEILNSEYNKWVAENGIGAICPPNFPEAYKHVAINAMDENGKQMCLDLLEYLIKKEAVVCVMVDKNKEEVVGFSVDRGKFVTKEQLFENFL